MLPTRLIKKRISYNYSKVAVILDLSASLFSSFQIDFGTRALLDSLRKNRLINYSKVLDLGCGCGIIGIFLKKQDPARQVDMTDRDLLATTFAAHNCLLNSLEISVWPSLDLEAVTKGYSLICCNFPASLEAQGLSLFLSQASTKLIRSGIFAIVVVNELKKDLEELVALHQLTVFALIEKANHTVFHLGFPSQLQLPQQPYLRGTLKLPLPGGYTLETAQGIGEFDTPSYGSVALFELLATVKSVNSVFNLEPDQGLAALAAAVLLKPRKIVLASRDLLALKFAASNIKRYFPGVPQQVALPFLTKAPIADLVIWSLKDKESLALHRHNFNVLLEREGPILIYGQELLVARLLEGAKVKILRVAQQGRYKVTLLQSKKL